MQPGLSAMQGQTPYDGPNYFTFYITRMNVAENETREVWLNCLRGPNVNAPVCLLPCSGLPPYHRRVPPLPAALAVSAAATAVAYMYARTRARLCWLCRCGKAVRVCVCACARGVFLPAPEHDPH